MAINNSQKPDKSPQSKKKAKKKRLSSNYCKNWL